MFRSREVGAHAGGKGDDQQAERHDQPKAGSTKIERWRPRRELRFQSGGAELV